MLRFRRADGRRNRRSLVLRFAVVSGLLTALLGTVLSVWLGNFVRTTNINQSRDLANYSMLWAADATGAKNNRNTGLSPQQYAASTRYLQSMVATDKFVGAVAWSSPTLIGFAADPGRTGSHETSRTQVHAGFAGQLSTLLVSKPTPGIPDVTERTALATRGPLLEIFIPVHIKGQVLAVVQLYQRWQPVQAQIAREKREVFALVAAGLGVLWLGLIGFVLSASRELRSRERANWHLASHDPLTGLPNRKLLRERVQQALAAADRSGRRVALLLLDLDGFKEVNDSLGHHCGDVLLEQIGPRLQGILRGADSVARLGGDEFVVLLPEIHDPAETTAAAQRITDCLAEPFAVDSLSIEVRASIGIAVSPDDGADFDTLLQHADVAMYAAKSAGSGVAAFSCARRTASPRKLALLTQLREAVAEPDQFSLDYQPRADLVSGEVRGVEALLRWHHPTEGVLPPSEFIPIAERTGLIMSLTTLVLERALADAHAWQSEGLPLSVSINISTRCLLDTKFTGMVNDLLHKHRVEPRQLVLELTESVIMADPDRVITQLQELAALGVRISIDDFGTGYSSMANLRRLPVDQLKIDQSFVAHLSDGTNDAAIVRSCVDLARNLGLTVVAEGVETAAQWNRLTELGVHVGQGFYLARPMSRDRLTAWIAERNESAARSADESVLRS